MIKVIETNTTLEDFYGELIPIDTQSRIIKVDNWNDYVEEIKQQKQVHRKSFNN